MISLSYEDKNFTQREDGFVNLGEMCSIHGKVFKDWNRTKSAQDYMEALAKTLTQSGGQICHPDDLVASAINAIGGSAGTWGHPLVAIEVARWISPEFGVWCNIHIKQLIETGKVELKPVQPSQVSLPPADIRIVNLHSALSGFGIDISNPRYNQAIQDLVVNRILGENTPHLPGDRWLGVVEKAELLGYSPSKIVQFRSSLGKFVASQSDSLDVRSECRLVNGTQRKVKLYRDCDELGRLVCEFMDAKVLAS